MIRGEGFFNCTTNAIPDSAPRMRRRWRVFMTHRWRGSGGRQNRKHRDDDRAFSITPECQERHGRTTADTRQLPRARPADHWPRWMTGGMHQMHAGWRSLPTQHRRVATAIFPDVVALPGSKVGKRRAQAVFGVWPLESFRSLRGKVAFFSGKSGPRETMRELERTISGSLIMKARFRSTNCACAMPDSAQSRAFPLRAPKK